jgi:outer membrane protein OmpA-like peptidoglycan-associated protein
MNTLFSRSILALAVAAACASCATVPAGPPPDIVRLQNDLGRLHEDPRTAANGGVELGNAEVAVDTLARNVRTLDARSYQQGVYISDKLVKVAEASALARYAEQRGSELGRERDRLMAGTSAQSRPLATENRGRFRSPDDHIDGPAPSRATLMSMQSQLSGLESSVDDRGLVVRLGDFMFEPSRPVLTSNAQRSLDSLAISMRDEASARARISAIENAPTDRAEAVRDYLVARGVDEFRLDLSRERGSQRVTSGDGRVEIVVSARTAPLARN